MNIEDRDSIIKAASGKAVTKNRKRAGVSNCHEYADQIDMTPSVYHQQEVGANACIITLVNVLGLDRDKFHLYVGDLFDAIE